MRALRPPVFVAVLLIAASSGWLLRAAPAAADDLNIHLNAGGAHALGDPQSHELGFGVTGSLALELPLGRVFGVQVEASEIWLSHANPPADPHIADHGAASALFGTLGVRLHPFGQSAVAGPWLDLDAGYVRTGSLNRPGLDTHLGYDFRVPSKTGDGRWDIGPFVGYAQVFQPGDTLRPEDAHMLVFGVHVALGAPPAVKARGDADGDGVFDDEDACIDVPGIRTTDPKTNGCPRGDRDHDGVFDDEDACIDVPGVRTTDPKTNGCPKPPPAPPPPPPPNTSDRDHDTVLDVDDACPDVPGVRTTDPKTNGCPPQQGAISVVDDHIVLNDVIYFETDVARVRHYSWPLVNQLAEYLNQHTEFVEVSIEGHTDEVGDDAHNLWLSQARADAVKYLLVHWYKVDDSRLKTRGFGKTRPISDAHDEAAHQKNRRVEFIITKVRQQDGIVAPTPSKTTTPPTTSNGGS